MTTFTDNLDGTGGDLLSARSGWSRTIGADDAAIVTGGSGVALCIGGGGAATGTWHTPTSQPSGNDQYVEAYIGAVNQAFPLGVRCDPSAAAGGGYLARCIASNTIELYRRSAAGVLLSLGTYTVPTPSDLTTNKVRLEVVGNDLTVTFMGSTVIGPVTRTDFASGSVAMLSRGGTYSSTVYTVDDWGSGDVGGGAVSHATSGVLAGLQAAIAGTASRSGAAVVHASSGALTGPGGIIAGSAALGIPSTDLTVTGGAWRADFAIAGAARVGGITVTGGTWH